MAIFAPQQAMMGRPGTGDPNYQRRQALSRQLMAQQTQHAPAYSWGEVLARALNPAVTAWSAKDEERAAQGRDDAFQKDYSGVVKQWQAGGGTQALAALLAGHTNKDVASLAPGQVIEDAKMQREQTIRGEDRAWRQAEADKDRAIAAQRHQESLALQRQAAARAGQGTYSNPVEVSVDGKPTLVRFNSRGGPPVDATTGRPVQGSVSLPQQPPAAPGGAFQGNAMDAQAYNMVVRGQQDPAFRATPEYAAAWNKLYSPRQVYNETSGQLVTIRPEVPQGFQGPGAASPQAPPAPAGDGFVMQPEQQASAAPAQPAPAAAAQPGQVVAQTPNATIQQVGPNMTPKFNEGQGKAAGFADRMSASHDTITRLEEAGNSTVQSALSAVPYAGNFLVSKERQQFEQAQRDFINAVLRRESGAVISPEEFDNARKQYFPQPGDSAAVIEQKRRNRQITLDSMRRDAGPAYQPRSTPPTGGDAPAAGKRLRFNPATGDFE